MAACVMFDPPMSWLIMVTFVTSCAYVAWYVIDKLGYFHD